MTRGDKIQIATVAASFLMAIIALGSAAVRDLQHINHKHNPAGAVAAGHWQHRPGYDEFEKVAKANP